VKALAIVCGSNFGHTNTTPTPGYPELGPWLPPVMVGPLMVAALDTPVLRCWDADPALDADFVASADPLDLQPSFAKQALIAWLDAVAGNSLELSPETRGPEAAFDEWVGETPELAWPVVIGPGGPVTLTGTDPHGFPMTTVSRGTYTASRIVMTGHGHGWPAIVPDDPASLDLAVDVWNFFVEVLDG
jgi:hypothetical protein